MDEAAGEAAGGKAKGNGSAETLDDGNDGNGDSNDGNDGNDDGDDERANAAASGAARPGSLRAAGAPRGGLALRCGWSFRKRSLG